MKSIYQVIRRPLTTEKTTLQSESAAQFSFEVDRAANRSEIKEAIERLFRVKVERVNTSIVRGKNRRAGRTTMRSPNWKKAIVTLKPGHKLELFEGV
jgi:large subunit ribosomal protein L23